MKKSRLIYLGLFIVLVLGIVFVISNSFKPLKKICIKDLCIRAEVVATEKSRERGLMFRKSMRQDQGMLFVFEKEALYNFWMKNTRFPLDIIWIDSQKRIVDIYEYALPCKDVCKDISPKATALYVLEVNAGLVKKHKIKIGVSLIF